MSHLLFLSHAGIDSEAALTLAERIENSLDAQRAGLRVFIDKADLRAGGRWKDQLQQALRDSTAFAVYVGSKGVVNWVWDEVSVALDRAHSEPAYPVIPVLSASADLTELPSFLSQYQAVTDVEKRPQQFEQFLRGILRVEARAQVAAEREPFVGLEAFDTHKAHLFFGREQEIDELATLLRHEPLIMVVGDSGAGKSSLVKAGLVPAFRGGCLGRPRSQGPDDTLWYVVETRPGTDPFSRLADDLRKAAAAAGKGPRAANEVAELVREKKASKVRDALLSTAPAEPRLETKVLLVVDQFEELRASPDAVSYADTLASLAPEGEDTIRVVLTMRRDYYYLCNSFSALYERLEQNNRRARYHLHRISRERLPKCVAEPLRLAGIASPVRTMLAGAVTKDAGDEPGELALLQMALWRTWARRTEHGGDLLRSYQAIGRIEGAIAHHAEEVFTSLTDEEKRRAEGLFLRLVRPGEAGGVTRRTAKLEEFDRQTQSLAKKLGGEQYRLLNLGEDTVEITHEALATQWQLYQRWISNSPADPRGDDLRTLQSLIADAGRWAQAESKNKQEHLARGYDLSLHCDLTARRPTWISGSERAYIDASQRAAVTAARLKQTAIAALVLLTCIASGFGYFAWNQRNAALKAQLETSKALELVTQKAADEDRAKREAERERDRADAELKKAQMTQSLFLVNLARQRRADGDVVTAMLLALEALPDHAAGINRPYAAEAELQLDGALRTRRELIVLGGHESIVESAAFSPDGKRIVTASRDKTARLWDSETGKPIGEPLRGHEDGPLRGHEDKAADGADRVLPLVLRVLTLKLSAAFSPDGKRIVTAASWDMTPRLWDGETGKPIGEPLRGHEGPVLSAAFSPDGKRIVTASGDKTARLWDGETGKPIGEPLKGHEDKAGDWADLFFPMLSAAFSPDGKRIVTAASWDMTPRLWDGETSKPIGEPLKGHKRPVLSAAFSPDGKRIVTASGDTTARLWDGETGKPIGEPLKGHQDELSAAFSPDGKRIVTASGKTARLWDGETGKPIGEPLRGHEDEPGDGADRVLPLVLRVLPLRLRTAFSPDGKRIVTAASWDMTPRLWDGETGKPIGEPLKGHKGPVWSVAFSPDGKRIVTASGDMTARLWDGETGKAIDEPLRGHEGPVWSAAFSPDGKRILTVSRDMAARLWDGETGKAIDEPLKGHDGPVLSAAFSPDGKRIVTAASWDKTARLWDGETGKPIGEPLKGHEGPVLSAAFSPDGNRIVTASWDMTARLWDGETGEPIGEPLKGHEGPVKSAAFSPDGKRIVTASWDMTARLWDGETGKPIGEPLKGHENIVGSAAFSPDGKRIVTASEDKTARLWDSETGKPIGEPLRGHERPVLSAAFSPDGKRIVTASGDKTARLWDGETGKPIGEPLKGHEDTVLSAAFGSDGKRIVTASADKTARLWDGETGKPIGEPLKGQLSAAFGSDGKRIVTASADKTARLWDGETGKLIGEPLRGHEGPVLSAAFSPDGKRIVTASEDKTARLWKIFANTQELVSHGKVAAPRCLSSVQLADLPLPLEPPPWCIDKEKWPYQTRAWKEWLSEKRAGRSAPLPPAP